jgi:quercetin dioxygenase-like cupin family protein
MTQQKTNRRETLAGITVIAGLAATKGWAMTEAGKETLSAAFHLDDIAQQNAETGGPWLQFFDNNTMLSGLYEIPAGGEDKQGPHKVDELYFVVKGKAMLTAADVLFPASAGSIFFVKADIPHRFIDIEEDLQVLVFFSKADPKGA